MWTLLKSFIKERITLYRIYAVRAMTNRVGAILRD